MDNNHLLLQIMNSQRIKVIKNELKFSYFHFLFFLNKLHAVKQYCPGTGLQPSGQVRGAC